MGSIRFLDDRLISQIAAGEVVERPASVVKELVENALDAGAREIRVELEAGGKRRIEVLDDGRGMDHDDALLAFDRHATSKISAFGDLEKIGTLGFRGEALASIAAVSRVALATAAEAGEGHLVRIEGGRVRGVEPVAQPRGTKVVVAGLFYNVPARRSFLKRPETELRRALEVVQSYALAHPEVRWRVRHGGRTLLEAREVGGESGTRRRIGQLFGADLADRLCEVVDPAGDDRIGGFVGDRRTVRGRRLFAFVNRRSVRDRAVLARFYRSLRESWKSDDPPALFLFLQLPPQEVDVNVHPQKAEVRFRDPGFLDRLEGALRASLESARGAEEASFRPAEELPAVPAAWEGLGGRWAEEVREERGAWRAEGGSPGAPAGAIARPVLAPIEPRPIPLSGRSGRVRPFRLLGQYKGSLILLEGPDGLYVVDQHVAHERLLYERLKRQMSRERPPSQRLLDPPVLELSAPEAMRLAELSADLERCGFSTAAMSGHAVALTAVPTAVSVEEARAIVEALATSEGEGAGEAAGVAEKILDGLAASLACRSAVKIHHPLSVDEMEALISELFDAEQPYACPHGRPVVLRMTDAELERRFDRR